MWRLDKAEAAEATAMVHLNAVRYYMINNIRRQQKVMGVSNEPYNNANELY